MSKNSSGCYVIDSDYNVVHLNETARKLYPQLQIGKKCYACLMGLDHPCGPCPVANGVKGPSTYTDPIRNISEIVDAVEMDVEGLGRCYGLVFSTIEKEAIFAATLPTTAVELRNLALVKALTVDYYDVFSADLASDQMTLYRHNGKTLNTDSIYRQIASYSKGTEDYIARYVLADDQEMMRRKATPEYLRKALAGAESVTIHYRVFWNDEIHYFFRKIARIGDADSFDHIVVGIGCEDEEVAERQQKIALQDNLRKVEYSAATGLLTREAFFVHGNELIKKYPDLDFDCCILQLESLNSINHQYGRLAGDKVVQLIGEILKTYEQETSCIAYFGDGVYGSLTQTTSTEYRTNAIAEFRDKILDRSEIKNLSMKWSLYKSISRELSIEEVYEKVVYTITTVRPAMRQDYVEFDQAMLDRLDWDRSVESGFKKALANGEFVAWYQPKYAVHTQQIIGAEALVRWVRPDGEIIPPARFIPVLENCGLIDQLDREIFRQVCRMQKAMADRGLRSIPISVNLSRASIFRSDIAQAYAAIAESFGVDPHLIPIEITESAAVRAEKIREFADSLIDRGFALHMDDFGAGYSSLASLQSIPFESIKLDKTLVDFIGTQSGESLLKHTIAFAKESGMTVVAEGVETMEQFMFLKVAGCDAIQGFYFSQPIEQEQLMQALR